MKKHIAIDLGASNGRVLVGDLRQFEVVHRFVTENDQILGEFYWDIQSLFREIKVGLKKAFAQYPDQIASIGIDTWGVDYVLVDQKGALVSLCYHYRDSRTDSMIEEVSARLGGESGSMRRQASPSSRSIPSTSSLRCSVTGLRP